MKKFSQWLVASVCVSPLLFSSVVQASGFQLFEHSGADMGNFGAGGAAIADDATTNFTNAAGLIRVPRQLVGAATVVNARTHFEGTACGGAIISLNPFINACVPAPSHDDGSKTAVVPALHYSYPVNRTIALGFSVTAPFGLATQYDDGDHADPIGYSATSSVIKTLNLNPNIAMKVSDHWALGLGFDAMRMSAVLNSRINLAPETFLNDSYARNYAKDWGYGWNAGVLYQPTAMTRIGLSFRSAVMMHLEGKSKIVGGGLNPNYGRLKANLKLPQTWILSAFHELNPRWDIMGTVMYTGWDTVKQLRLRNAVIPTGQGGGTTTGTVALPQNFDNTWRVAIGADYKASSAWRLRAGIGFDRTPVNNYDRTVRLPDGNRTAVAFGAKYTFNPALEADFGYTHLFFKDGKINQDLALSGSVGKSESSANLYGMQLTWNLC